MKCFICYRSRNFLSFSHVKGGYILQGISSERRGLVAPWFRGARRTLSLEILTVNYVLALFTIHGANALVGNYLVEGHENFVSQSNCCKFYLISKQKPMFSCYGLEVPRRNLGELRRVVMSELRT